MIEVRNASIKSISLSNEDHGCLSAWLHLDYGGTGQGFGGYNLFSPPMKLSPNYCGWFIWRCLEIGGVSEWNRLPGRTIRVRSDMTRVESIGHILKDDWFNPSTDFKTMELARNGQ